MLERLNKSFREQERFTSLIAHRANLEVALQDEKTKEMEFREMAQTLGTALSRLENLVEDLLLLLARRGIF